MEWCIIKKNPAIDPFSDTTKKELDFLCSLIRQEKVILWVGSGFSTYAGYPAGDGLWDILENDLKRIKRKKSDIPSKSLKDAADQYVHIKHRESLIKRLKKIFCKKPRQKEAHELLYLINRVKYIITTNYDRLFEIVYGEDLTVILHDDGLPKISDNPNKTILLKIHGDLSDPDSIVITSDDYDRFDNDTIVWSKIKTLLAENSVLFIGYSIGDPNVTEMLDEIYRKVGSRKHPYFFISKRINESKKEDLKNYNLRFIESDAINAIDYISKEVIQHAFLDGMKNPSAFEKSERIFDEQGFEVSRNIKRGKMTNVVLEPNRPDVHSEFSLSVCQKIGDGSTVQKLDELFKGLSFDPITFDSTNCDINIPSFSMGDVRLIDPSTTKFQEITISPKPKEEISVDLYSKKRKLRLNCLMMSTYSSLESEKWEINDPDFKLSIQSIKSTLGGSINFTVKHIISNVSRACIIYGLFNSWVNGESIYIVSSSLSIPIPNVNRLMSDNEKNQIKAIYRVYQGLNDIQDQLGIKFQIPPEIEGEELRKIIWVSDFITGHKDVLPEFSGSIDYNEKSKSILKKDLNYIKISGEIWEELSIFNQKLVIPFKIEGFNSKIMNKDEVYDAIERGDKEIPLKLKSETDQLYREFSPEYLDSIRRLLN